MPCVEHLGNRYNPKIVVGEGTCVVVGIPAQIIKKRNNIEDKWERVNSDT